MWVIIPVGAMVFKALEDVCTAMDPRSGTLVLFCPWKNELCPMQHFFTTGIHQDKDNVSFKIAAADYMEQIKELTGKNKVKILEMTPAPFSDTNEYMTRIKFRFKEGTTPFLINLQCLPTISGQASGTSRGCGPSCTSGCPNASPANQNLT